MVPTPVDVSITLVNGPPKVDPSTDVTFNGPVNVLVVERLAYKLPTFKVPAKLLPSVAADCTGPVKTDALAFVHSKGPANVTVAASVVDNVLTETGPVNTDAPTALHCNGPTSVLVVALVVASEATVTEPEKADVLVDVHCIGPAMTFVMLLVVVRYWHLRRPVNEFSPDPVDVTEPAESVPNVPAVELMVENNPSNTPKNGYEIFVATSVPAFNCPDIMTSSRGPKMVLPLTCGNCIVFTLGNAGNNWVHVSPAVTMDPELKFPEMITSGVFGFPDKVSLTRGNVTAVLV